MNKVSVPTAVLISTGFLISAILFSIFVFGGVPVGPILAEEIPMIEAWISWSNLDAIGGYQKMVYPEGKPIFTSPDRRYSYIRSNHRQRPWLKISGDWMTTLAPNEFEKISRWKIENKLNEFGDPFDTFYTGGTPLFDETIGEQIELDEYLLRNHPTRPWNYTYNQNTQGNQARSLR